MERTRPTRRAFLAGATTVAAGTLAGCTGSLLHSTRSISPEEPADPLEGTPGEFYSLLERNDVDVESLSRDGADLVLVYHTSAADDEAFTEEVGTIVTVFNEVLVRNETGVEMLYADLPNSGDELPRGWGVQTEWLEGYNEGEVDEMTLWSNVLNSQVYDEDLEDLD